MQIDSTILRMGDVPVMIFGDYHQIRGPLCKDVLCSLQVPIFSCTIFKILSYTLLRFYSYVLIVEYS